MIQTEGVPGRETRDARITRPGGCCTQEQYDGGMVRVETGNDKSRSKVQHFELPRTIWASRGAYVAAGLACLAGSVVCIDIGVRLDWDLWGQVGAGVCLTLGTGFMYSAWMTRQSPHEIVLGQDGLILVYAESECPHPWTDFVHAEKSKAALTSEPVLFLYDTEGRRAVRISGEFDGFVLRSLRSIRFHYTHPLRGTPRWLQTAPNSCSFVVPML